MLRNRPLKKKEEGEKGGAKEDKKWDNQPEEVEGGEEGQWDA